MNFNNEKLKWQPYNVYSRPFSITQALLNEITKATKRMNPWGHGILFYLNLGSLVEVVIDMVEKDMPKAIHYENHP